MCSWHKMHFKDEFIKILFFLFLCVFFVVVVCFVFYSFIADLGYIENDQLKRNLRFPLYMKVK